MSKGKDNNIIQQLKRQKDMEITREQAIEKMIKYLIEGYSIPMCVAVNGWSGFSWLTPMVDIDSFLKFANDTENFSFKTVPMDKILEDFEQNNVDVNEYDICVEFEEKVEKKPYKEQYLIWNVD